MDNNDVTLKRGETLYSEGDKIEFVYMLKSGRIKLIAERGGKRIELFDAGKGQLLGDEAILNPKAKHFATAVCESQVNIIKVPVEILRAQAEKGPPGLKVFIKGMSDDLKALRARVKSHILENDSSPMPDKMIPRVFGCIGIIAQHAGHSYAEYKEQQDKATTPFQKAGSEEPQQNPYESDDSVVLQWVSLKLYAARFFLESHRRIEFALMILEKLGLAEQHYEKDEHDQDVLKEVILHQPRKIEAMAEFYQYHLYKGGQPEILRVDNMAWNIAKVFVQQSEGLEPDFRGSTHVDYNEFVEKLKEATGIDFKGDHMGLLERKGLFVRRQNKGDVTTLAFDREEFESTCFNWTILREVAALNETGVVDPKIDDGLPKVTASADESACPACEAVVAMDAKFCSECGHKIQEAA